MNPAPPASSSPRSIDLVCHPATPSLVPMAVEVQWAVLPQNGGWALQLTYTVSGDIQRLRLPKVAVSGPADGLWAHTCFEAFVSEPGSAAYRELNFSPSTQWAHYRFVKERVRDQGPVPLAPMVQAPEVVGDRCVLAATVAAVPLSSNAADNLFAPTAVLENNDGQRSYWAARHPSAQPDFHNRAGWAIPLAWSIA